MPICPNCKTEQTKRKDGGCPRCGTPVQVFGGRWYREEIGCPTVSLLEHFERRVSKRQSAMKGFPVKFTIPRKSLRYKRELVQAERMLDAAEGDYDAAMRALDILFEDPQFSFKTRTSLIGILIDYNLSVAIATAEKLAKEKVAQKQAEYIDKVYSCENIWS
jgi:hypothetical protein